MKGEKVSKAEWKSIKSAPKTGELYIACNINTGQVCVENRPARCAPGCWTKVGNRWCGMANSLNATHWHPCPALPDLNRMNKQQAQELHDLIIADVRRLPTQHDKDRVCEIAEEMFSEYAGELEFFSAISVISRSLSAMQREGKIEYP